MNNVAEFYSNAKIFYPLSNFHLAPISLSDKDIPDEIHQLFPSLRQWIGTGKNFNSSEHLWQSLKSNNYKTFIKFTNGEIFGSVNPLSFFQLLDPKTAQSKVDFG